MPHISVKVSEPLFQELEQKAQELNLEKSVLIRDFLRSGLDNFSNQETPTVNFNEVIKQNLSYNIITYCLVEKAILEYVQEGPLLQNQAQTKAKKLINHFLQKVSETDAETFVFS